MAAEPKYNLKSPAVKRIMVEAKELREPTEMYHAQPLEENIFEWHFTVRGPADTAFAGGIYHGRILLPPEYPYKPPNIILLTPNGRFEVGKKICLSISAYHPEYWRPSWSIRTVLLALISFMPTKGEGAIGALDYTDDERKALALKSPDYRCPTCQTFNRDALPALTGQFKAATTAEEDELINNVSMVRPREGGQTDQKGEGEGEGEAMEEVPAQGEGAGPSIETEGLRQRHVTASQQAHIEPQAHSQQQQQQQPAQVQAQTQTQVPPPRLARGVGEAVLTLAIWAVAAVWLWLVGRHIMANIY